MNSEQINFQYWVDFFKTILVVRVKTKQKSMKNAKYLSLIFWKEFVLKNGKTENQELTGNLRKTELPYIFRNKSKFYYSPKTFSTLCVHGLKC